MLSRHPQTTRSRPGCSGRQSHELALMKGMQRVQQRRREHSGTGVSASVSEQQGMTGTDQPVQRRNWGTGFVLPLGVAGAVLGTLLDGIHSKDQLQIYGWQAISVGGLNTSLSVPPLLALFYIVLGALTIATDNRLASDPATTKAINRASNPWFIALCFGALAASLQLSAYLYASGVPYSSISLALAAVTAASWVLLDGTKQGLGLMALCGLGAPVAEMLLLEGTTAAGLQPPLWSYPHPDLFGGRFVSWVFFCYAFYTPTLCALARHLWQRAGRLTQLQDR